MNTSTTYEMNMDQIESVSGGIFPVVIAAVAAGSFAAGYVAGKNS